MGVGLFGKYPRKRDFVVLNLPREVLGPLEGWFQSAVAASQQTLGKCWTKYYLVQPIWDFRIGRHITGTDCVGAFVPSVDEVGRYFPLMLVAYADPRTPGFPLWPMLECKPWLEAIHERLLSALGENNTSDPPALLRGLLEPDPAARTLEGIETINGGYRLSSERGEAPPDKLLRFTEAYEAGADRSLWWTGGGAYVKRQLLSVRGMPDPYAFADMVVDYAYRDNVQT